MIDYRLLDGWQSASAARQQARDSLPASWRNDPRPKMREVCEAFIEGMLQMNRPSSKLVALRDDDR